MTVQFEIEDDEHPQYNHGDRVTAYGDNGTVVGPDGENNTLVRFDGQKYYETVRNVRISRCEN